MRDAEVLWVLALVFYLSECLVRVPIDAEAFVRPLRQWRWQSPWILRSGRGPAFVLAPPTLPSGLVAVASRSGRHAPNVAADRGSSFLSTSRNLRWLQAMLALVVFGGGGLLVWWDPMPAEPTFLCMGVFWLAVIVEGVRVQRRSTGPGRALWREVIVALSSPIAAMRLGDVMAKRLVADLSGLSVAVALLSPEGRRAVLRPALARARHLGDGDPTVISRLAMDAGLDLVALERPPEAESADALSYCPVCEAQYLIATGTCSGCSDVKLMSFGH